MSTGTSISSRAMRRLALVTSTSLVALAVAAFVFSMTDGARPASAAQTAPPAGPVAQPLQAFTDTKPFFLKLDGIEGDSTVPGQEGALELLSWSFGGSRPAAHATGGGGGTGKVQMQDFHFTTKVSKATPKLFLRCANGEHIKEATLTMRKAGGGQHEYLVITLSDAQITSYQMGGGSGDPIPTDEVSINFAKVKIDYFPPGQDNPDASPVSSSFDATSGRDG